MQKFNQKKIFNIFQIKFVNNFEEIKKMEVFLTDAPHFIGLPSLSFSLYFPSHFNIEYLQI